MRKEANLSYTLNLGETILLLCLALESGLDLFSAVVEIDNTITGTPFVFLAKKISETKSDSNILDSGNLFLLAAHDAESLEEKAFFSLLAASQFSGMKISDKLRWMSEVFQRPGHLNIEEAKKRNEFLIQKISPFAKRVGCDFDCWKKYLQGEELFFKL